MISGYCLCRANGTLPARQSRSRPPFLLRQEAAGGDVEPQYESLQLGLFCCLPRLISFNYLSPFFFFFSPFSFPNPRFLSSDYFLPLPTAAAGSACLLAITIPSPHSCHLSPFVLHQIIPSCLSPGCTPRLFACLAAFACRFSPFFLTWMAIAFLHPIPGMVLAVFTTGASSLAGILHPGPGCTRSPIAICPVYFPNPDGAPLQSPGSWQLLAKLGEPRGAAAPPVPWSPCTAFAVGGGDPTTSPHLLCFSGPDALFSAADAAGVGKITVVVERARAHPGDAGFSCHGLFCPSSIKPGETLTTQEVFPRRWHLFLPWGDVAGTKTGAEGGSSCPGDVPGAAPQLPHPAPLLGWSLIEPVQRTTKPLVYIVPTITAWRACSLCSAPLPPQTTLSQLLGLF